MTFGIASTSWMRIATLVLLAVSLTACGESDPGFGGRRSADWIRQLDQASPSDRAYAAQALGEVLRLNPSYSPAVQALVRTLGDTADEVRVAAATALANKGVRAPDAVPGVIVVIGDTAHAEVRATGGRVLSSLLTQLPTGRWRPRTAEDSSVLRRGVDVLASATGDRDVRVRIVAAEGLRDLGVAGAAASPRVEPALAALATSPVPALRVLSLEGLSATGAAPAILVPTARTALSDPDPSVRLAGVQALERLGSPAAPAVSDLIPLLSDPNTFVRIASARAIGEIDPGPASAALRNALRDPSASVRREAEHALQGFHREGGEDPPPSEPGRERP